MESETTTPRKVRGQRSPDEGETPWAEVAGIPLWDVDGAVGVSGDQGANLAAQQALAADPRLPREQRLEA